MSEQEIKNTGNEIAKKYKEFSINVFSLDKQEIVENINKINIIVNEFKNLAIFSKKLSEENPSDSTQSLHKLVTMALHTYQKSVELQEKTLIYLEKN